MKKMFVAFGIAIALTFGMVLGTAEEAHATEITEDVKYEQRFEEMLDEYFDDVTSLAAEEAGVEDFNAEIDIIAYYTEEETDRLVGIAFMSVTSDEGSSFDIRGVYVDEAYDMLVDMGY